MPQSLRDDGLGVRLKREVLLVLAVAAGLAACSSTESAPHSATDQAVTPATPQASGEGGNTLAGVPFSLLTHCGIASTEYAGRAWVAATPLPEPRPRADATGVITRDGYTDGQMTLVEDDLLRFVVTDPLVEEAGLTVDFVPATAPVPLCE
jgi:hypothetical protein